VRSIFVPADEICFPLLAAASAADVSKGIEAAGIAAQRVVDVDDA